MRALTQQQIAFCKYYALYGGQRGAGAKAAKEAQYSAKSANSTAYHLLKKPEIQKRIEEEKKALADKVEMTTIEIISRYQDMAKIQGDYTKATVADAERALRQLAKYKSMRGFTDKLVIEHKIPFNDWTVEERDAYIEKGIVPRGRRLPEIEGISPIISREISEKSGTGNN